MIRGYFDQPSVIPGDTLILHVSTDAPQFRVEFYRLGATFSNPFNSDWLPGTLVPDGKPDRDWGMAAGAFPGWPSFQFAIPGSWPSGLYAACLKEGDAVGTQLSPATELPLTGRLTDVATFVVKSGTPGSGATILYLVEVATEQAYNEAGGLSLYTPVPAFTEPPDPPGGKVSLRRPVVFDTEFDVPLIAWLERSGYQYLVDYCTDVDLHQDSDTKLLSAYSMLLVVGHSEYWSLGMRDHVEAFVARGGNVAFFSSNTCWWRIHFVDDDTAIVCDKDYLSASDKWWAPYIDFNTVSPGNHPGQNRPENSLTGVSFRNAVGWYAGTAAPRPDPLGFLAQHAEHWVYYETGLRNGDEFGKSAGWFDSDEHGLVGIGEVDGADYVWEGPLAVTPDWSPACVAHSEAIAGDPQASPPTMSTFAVATGKDGTPKEFVILGIAPLCAESDHWVQRTWDVIFGSEVPGPAPHQPTDPTKASYPASQAAAATLGIYTRPGQGTVFNTATYRWTQVLGGGEELGISSDPTVDRISRNVLNRLGLGGTMFHQLWLGDLEGAGAQAIAGFDTADGVIHVLVARADGKLLQLEWPGEGFWRWRGSQTTIPGDFVGMAAYVQSDGSVDPERVVAGNTGTIYQATAGIGDLLTEAVAVTPSPDGIIDLTALATVDGVQHVFALLADGSVQHLLIQGQLAWAQSAMRIEGDPVGITAYQDPQNGQVHVVAASENYIYQSICADDGTVPAANGIAQLDSGIQALAGLAIANGFQYVFVASPNGYVRELLCDNTGWRWRGPIMCLPGLIDLAAFNQNGLEERLFAVTADGNVWQHYFR